MGGLQALVRQPCGPAAGLTEVDGKNPACQAFASQERATVRVEGAPVDEERVG
jgi:hypothetical protein